MKKIIFFLILPMALISCSVGWEDVPNDPLVGAWADSSPMEDTGFAQSLIYRFNSDQSFDVSSVIVENSTAEIIGYRYHSEGTYSVNGNQISLNQIEIYTHNDLEGHYVGFEDLEPIEGTSQLKAAFMIHDNLQTLTLKYGPCGPNQNCITSQSFKRLN